MRELSDIFVRVRFPLTFHIFVKPITRTFLCGVRGGAGAAARIGEMQNRNGAGVLGGIESRV